MRLKHIDTIRVPWISLPRNPITLVKKKFGVDGLAIEMLESGLIVPEKRLSSGAAAKEPFHMEIVQVELLFGGTMHQGLTANETDVHCLLRKILEDTGRQSVTLNQAIRLGYLDNFSYPHLLFAFGTTLKVPGKPRLRIVPGVWIEGRNGRLCIEFIDAHNLNGMYILVTPLQRN